MNTEKQSAGKNKTWLVAFLLSGVLVVLLYLLRRLKLSAKEKHDE